MFRNYRNAYEAIIASHYAEHPDHPSNWVPDEEWGAEAMDPEPALRRAPCPTCGTPLMVDPYEGVGICLRCSGIPDYPMSEELPF